MPRLSSLTLAIAALLAVPASSYAGDPLLSGYGGPGGGEQVLLGSQLLGRHGGGSGGSSGGSLRAAATPATTGTVTGAGAAGASATAGTATGSASTGVRSAAATTRHGGGHHHGAGRRDAATGAGAATAAPHRVAYPAEAGDAGGPALSAADLLIAALALAAAGAMGLWLRRLAAGGGAQAAP